MNHLRVLKSLVFAVILFAISFSCTDNKQKIREEINMGIKATYTGNWKDAIDHFDYVIDIDSTNAEAYMYLGRAYFGMRKYIKAMNMLDKSIALNPKFGEAYRSRAQVNFVLGNKDESCKDYLKAEEFGVENLYNYTKHCK